MGGNVTPRSDLYSLGAMLYEMVTGRPPFLGDDSVAIIGQHLNTPPVAPSWHNPSCPTALEVLILRLLEKDPSKRSASASEVHAALESIDLSSAHPEPVEGQAAPADNPIYHRTFVGRESELRQLESAFDNALSGAGSLTMVVGEPGIGKTAVCEQLAPYVTLRGGKSLVGHCYEEGSLSLPYLALVEARRSYVLERDPQGLESDLGTGAADVARIVSEIRDRVQVELRPPGDPEDDRWRLLQGVTTFLRNASTVQPLCIVLEDLHWSDQGTLDLLIHMARNLQGARLLIVGTYRDVEVNRAHPLSSALAELRRGSAFERVPQRGLTVDEVHRMINAVAGQEVRWALAEGVHRQTEGNPLFIQEVLRYFVEEGLLKRQDGWWVGRWRETGEAPLEMVIPEGLRDVIGKRLLRLSQECNRLLSIAAVIGRDFALETLQAIAGMSEEEVLVGLEEALKVGVVEDQSRGAIARFRFTHAFFRQTLYEETIAPRRIRLHQQVAQALQSQYTARLEEHAVELAEHFAFYSDPEGLAMAVDYSEVAARRAMSVFDYGEASRLLERAIGVQEVLDPDDKTKRCDLLLELGEALMPAGEPQRVFETVAPEACEFAESLDDSDRVSRACQLALTALHRYGAGSMAQTPEYGQWAEKADRHAKPGTVDRVYADIYLGVRRGVVDGDLIGEWRLKQRALKLARELADPQALFQAIFSILGRLQAGGDEARYALAREFAVHPRAGVNARTLGSVLFYIGRYHLVNGERGVVEELWREVDELATRTQDPNVLFLPLQTQLTLRTLDGRLEEVLEAGEDLIARAQELGIPRRGRQFALQQTLWPLLYLGRTDQVLEEMEQFVSDMGLTIQGYSRAVRGLIPAHLGQRGEAEDILHNSIKLLDQVDAQGDETATGLPVILLQTAVLLEAAAVLLGETDKARDYYHQALEACAKIGFRPEIALTRLHLAELLLDHYPDERPEAMEHLEFAIGEFRDMKMQPSLERGLRHRETLKA